MARRFSAFALVLLFTVACGETKIGANANPEQPVKTDAEKVTKNAPPVEVYEPSSDPAPVCYIDYDGGYYHLRKLNGEDLGSRIDLGVLTKDVVAPLRNTSLCRSRAVYPDFHLEFHEGLYEVHLGGLNLGSRTLIRSAINDIIGPLLESGLYRAGDVAKGREGWDAIVSRAAQGFYRKNPAKACEITFDGGWYHLKQGGADLGQWIAVTDAIEHGVNPLREVGLCTR